MDRVTVFLYSIHTVVFLIGAHSILWEIRTESLHILFIYINLVFKI
jgi:hypothetical protein